MAEEKVKYVTWTIFTWTIGIILGILMMLGSADNTISSKVSAYQVEESKTQSQLSQIQTDLTWIKKNLEK